MTIGRLANIKNTRSKLTFAVLLYICILIAWNEWIRKKKIVELNKTLHSLCPCPWYSSSVGHFYIFFGCHSPLGWVKMQIHNFLLHFSTKKKNAPTLLLYFVDVWLIPRKFTINSEYSIYDGFNHFAVETTSFYLKKKKNILRPFAGRLRLCIHILLPANWIICNYILLISCQNLRISSQ